MKNHHHNGPIHPTAREQVHESIAIKAYDGWMRAGQPDNQSEELWLAAEQEVLSGRRATVAGGNEPTGPAVPFGPGN